MPVRVLSWSICAGIVSYTLIIARSTDMAEICMGVALHKLLVNIDTRLSIIHFMCYIVTQNQMQSTFRHKLPYYEGDSLLQYVAVMVCEPL